MLINAQIIASCQGAIDKKDIREHLRAICFDFDEQTNKLSIIGTNAQIMIVNTIKITNESDIAFCKKHFTDNQAYFWDRELNKKEPFCEFTEIDGKLVLNGVILSKLEQTYPMWRAIIPTKDLKKATAYCGWNQDLIKQIDKALGWKYKIMTYRPVVNGDETPDSEFLAPHRWDLNIYDNCDTIVLCMPMRIE